jgi:hypothetical protein
VRSSRLTCDGDSPISAPASTSATAFSGLSDRDDKDELPRPGRSVAPTQAPGSAARHRPDDEKGLFARDDRLGENGVGWVVGEVLLTGEKADEGAARSR